MNILCTNLVAILTILIMASGAVGQTREASSDRPDAKAYLASQIPPCSMLHQNLGLSINTIDKSYMQLMRQEGIRRITLAVEAIWHHNNISGAHITQRLYFRQYDDSSSQIADPDRLKSITASEMERLVDQEVINRASSTQFVHGIDGGGGAKEGQLGNAVVNVFDTALFPGFPLFFSHALKSKDADFLLAAHSGDSQEVERIIGGANVPPKDLKQALFSAVSYYFDNRVVIEMLLHAGAGVNAHDDFGVPVLLNAIVSPCNLEALLKNGANPDERDKGGKTALQRAKEQNQVEAVRILESASGKQ
jgi:hypothetical protein